MTLFQMTTLAGACATASQIAYTRDRNARQTGDARPAQTSRSAASLPLVQSLFAGLIRSQTA